MASPCWISVIAITALLVLKFAGVWAVRGVLRRRFLRACPLLVLLCVLVGLIIVTVASLQMAIVYRFAAIFTGGVGTGFTLAYVFDFRR